MNPTRTSKEKRKRSSMACTKCRARKVRCSVEDGLPCYNCRADGIHCRIPEHRRKRPRRPHSSIGEHGTSPSTQDPGHGLVISRHTDGHSEQSPTSDGIGDFHTLDESPNFSIADAKLSELPPTPAPSVAAGSRPCPQSWTASTLHCPPPTRNPPNFDCNGESRKSHGQTHVSFDASLGPKCDQSQVFSPRCREDSDLGFAECGDLDLHHSQSRALKGAPRIKAAEHDAVFQNLVGLANNLARLAYSLSLRQRPCHMTHTRCDCQEYTMQELYPTSCDHARYSTQKRQQPKCDTPYLDSCFISPVDTSESNTGIFEDDVDELSLERLLTTSWPTADIGKDLSYQEL